MGQYYKPIILSDNETPIFSFNPQGEGGLADAPTAAFNL